jgi:hypothetical protein
MEDEGIFIGPRANNRPCNKTKPGYWSPSTLLTPAGKNRPPTKRMLCDNQC